MLQHEILVVLDWEFALLLHQIIVLTELELELVDEHLYLLFRHSNAFLPFVALLQQLLQKLFRLKLDDRSNLEERHAGLSRAISR